MTNFPIVTSSDIVYFNTATHNVNYPGFSDINGTINSILGTGPQGYGYGLNTTPYTVDTNSLIQAQDWINLKANLDIIYNHQTNSSTFITNNPAPQPGQAIDYGWIDEIIIETDKLLVKQFKYPPPGQFAITTVSTTTDATAWSTIETDAVFDWSNYSDPYAIDYFFNLGGQINFNIGYVSGYDPSLGTNATLASLLDYYGPSISTISYNKSNFVVGQQQILKTYNNNGNTATIYVSYTGGSQLTATIFLSDPGYPGIQTNIQIINEFICEYSIHAVPAPTPIISVGGGSVTPPAITRILSVNSPSTYSWTATEGPSTAQNIVISNLGNTSATISNIIFNNATGVVAVLSNPLTLPCIVPPSSSVNFGLAYNGSIVENVTSSFTILSNNNAGSITINTVQDVAAVPIVYYTFTLGPSVSTTWGNSTVLNQVFSITNVVPPNGQTYSSYSASLSNINNFSISNTALTGPTITFNPRGLVSGTYSTILTVTIGNSAPQTATFTVVFTAPLNYNIASWLSPYANYNSVVGISYDVIDGNKYLTVGIGVGADGSPIVANGGTSYALLENLSYNADNAYTQGQPQYPSFDSSGNWDSFMETYAVWPNNSTNESATYGYSIPQLPVDVWAWTVSYNIYFPISTTYYITWNADNYGTIFIDSTFLGSIIYNGSESYTTIYLTAGYHVLSGLLQNINGLLAGNPGGIAILIQYYPTIYYTEILWTTRYPVRTETVYNYWAEVYRFPIGNTAETLRTYDNTSGNQFNTYCVKNTYPVLGNYNYGYYFPIHSIISVTNDGNGNLSISLSGTPSTSGDPNNNITLIDISTSFYYYWPSSNRLSQLSNGPIGNGSQTYQFAGFTNAGNTVTNIVTIPSTSLTVTTSVTVGGGGGGGIGTNKK